MFSEKFNQLATLVGIDTTQLTLKCDNIEEKFKDTDKSDVNVGVDWLNSISMELTSKELAFLLMASLAPEASMEDYQNDDEGYKEFKTMMEENGYIQFPDGSFGKEINLDDYKQPNKPDEPKQISYLSATEPNRNALGYDHSLESVIDSVGIDVDLLNRKLDISLKEISDNGDNKLSKIIEKFEREFTRKELSYMYNSKAIQVKELKEVIESAPKPKTRTTKNKKENGNI